MKNMLMTVVQSLVDKPEEVNIIEITGGHTVVFELHVAKDEVGKVIGKQGSTAKALRQILHAVATKLGKRAVLEIIE